MGGAALVALGSSGGPAWASSEPRDVLATAASAAALPGGAHFETSLGPGLRMYRLAVPAGRSARAYSRELERRPGVSAAQPNWVLRATGQFSSCTEAPSEANLTLPGNLNALQNQVVTDPIAILDTGVDDNTPELALRVRPGFNTPAGTDNTLDSDGHGTQVASAAAGSTATGLVGGVSAQSPIIPITIYNSAGTTTVDWVVKGITQAANRGAAVINISSSAFVTDTEDAEQRVFARAIASAFSRGVITVGAIGNENRGDPVIPGSLPHVLTVGSASTAGTRDPFSNYGDWLDLVAPGANLVLPAPAGICTSGYGDATGTSFSAPQVAAGVALIKAAHPRITVTQLFDLARRLSATAFTADETGHDGNTGFGILNVASGAAATPVVNEPRELDDDVYWLKQDSKTHPTYLRSGRKVTLTGAISPGKDPQDVVPVYLKKGETVTATALTKTKFGLFEATIWSPSTSSFDIGNGSTHGFLRDSGGFSSNPQSSYRAPRTGTYYVAVGAPDLHAEKDSSVNNVTLATRMTYTLTVTKKKTAPPKKKTTKKK